MQAMVNSANKTVNQFLDDGENLTDDQSAHYFLVPNVDLVAMPECVADSIDDAVCKWENSHLEWFALDA